MKDESRLVTPFNGCVYHCYECKVEMILESYEEMAHATRNKGLCEDCFEKLSSD